MSETYVLGIDAGGTHTDAVLLACDAAEKIALSFARFLLGKVGRMAWMRHHKSAVGTHRQFFGNCGRRIKDDQGGTGLHQHADPGR